MAQRAWQGATYGISGDREIRAKLERMIEEWPIVAFDAMVSEWSIELEEGRRRAPIGAPPDDPQPGRLRASGRLIEESVEGGGQVTLAFGGEEFGVPYGVAQHQGYYQHPQGGQREFLLSVMEESRGFIGERIVRRLEQGMTRFARAA
jgi:hypothetical protein